MGNKHSDLAKNRADNPIIIKSYVARNQSYDGIRAGSTLGLSGPYYGPTYYQEHTYDPRQRRKSASVIGGTGDFLVVEQQKTDDKENIIRQEEKSPTTVKNGEPKFGRLMSNTDDSGYNTFCLTDSDKSRRARTHGSRASLLQEEGADECATAKNAPHQPQPVLPPQPRHVMQPNFVAYPPPPPPHFFGLLPHPPPQPMFLPPPPQLNETKAEKKMRKKFEKQILKQQQQRIGSSNDVFFGRPPPMMPFMAPPRPPPSLFGGPRPPPTHLYKTKSVDNIANGADFFGPNFAPGPMFDDPRFSTMPQPQGPFAFPLPLPPPKCHSASHSDVHSVLGVCDSAPNGQLQQPATHGRKGKAYYKEKRRTGAGSVDGLSLSGGLECQTSVFDQTVRKFRRGLSKSRKENSEQEEQNTKFEEERMVQNMDDVTQSPKSPSRDQNGVVFRSTADNEKIYESLRGVAGDKNANSLLTTADVEFEKNRETKAATLDFSRPDSLVFQDDCKSTEKNANGVSHQKMLVTEDARQVMLKNEKLLAEAEAKKVDEKSEVTVGNLGEVSVENLETIIAQSTTTPSENHEKMVEPILHPFLPKRQISKPQNFDPMDSWRSLNSIKNLQILRDHYQQYDLSIGREIPIKENLRTKIYPQIPNRFAQPEPVYLEYDEKLPEFKKRLIETGTFDFGPPTTTSKIAQQEKSPIDFRKDERRNEFSPNSINRNEKFKTNSTNRPTENSDIDFSWVNDLENRFRREREQFDREIENRKKTLQRHNDDEKFDTLFMTNEKTDRLSTNADTNYDQERIIPIVQNNVRQKLAMFENEAQRLQQKEMEMKQHQKRFVSPERKTHLPEHYANLREEEPIYIPKPDYDNDYAKKAAFTNGYSSKNNDHDDFRYNDRR